MMTLEHLGRAALAALLVSAAACDSQPQALTEADLEQAENLDLLDDAQPSFFPFDERPRLENRGEMAELLKANYPAELKSQGIGGQAVIWLHIDEVGEVRHVVINKSSGNEALDGAAIAVARHAQFSPARNNGEATEVWIAIPLQFKPQGT